MNGRPVTLKDIARLAGLSVPAVSLSLLDNPSSTVKISDETRRKVRKIAEKLGYRPNLAAQALSKGSTHTVGIITFQTASAQSHVHLQEARPLLAASGLSSFLYFVEERSSESILQACHAMIDARVSGVLLYLPLEQSSPHTFDPLKQFGLPVASVGGHFLEGVSRYMANETEGFALLTEHLLDEGCRKIALVTYEDPPSAQGKKNAADRTSSAVTGFQSAIKRARRRSLAVTGSIHRVSRAMIQQGLPLSGDIDEHYLLGYLAMRRLIEIGDLPEAVIFQADGKALGALRACSEAGVRVPHDVAIAGFNDDRSCSAGYIPLTSVALPATEMTRMAVADLIKRIRDKKVPAAEPVYLPCSVKVRQSTARRPLPPSPGPDLSALFR